MSTSRSRELQQSQTEGDALGPDPTSRHRSGRTARTIAAHGWTVFATAAAFTVGGLTMQVATTGTGVQAQPTASAGQNTQTGRTDEATAAEVHYVACMLDAAGTPDSLEHWVEPCRRRATQNVIADANYVACMLDAPGAADSLERWVEPCRSRAAEVTVRDANYVVCMLDAPGTADSLERWAETCDDT